MMREYFWDALIFPFFEKNGIKSFLMFLVLSAICSGIAVLFRGNQIIYWIMAIIVIIYSFGYLTILAHNKINNKEEIIPRWNNFREFFKKGFLTVTIILIYVIVMASVFSAFFVCIALLLWCIKLTSSIIIFLIFLFYFETISLFMLLFLPIVHVFYAQNMKSLDAFRLKKIFSLVFRNIPVLLLMYLNIGILYLPYMLSKEVTKGIKLNITVTIPETIIYLYVMASIVYLSASYGRELLIKEKILKTIDQQP
mgnify:FL=1